MAVKNEARMATNVNNPSTGATLSAWEKVAPFLITAWKHPICVCVAFEKIRTDAEPSKSGICRAISGIPETSEEDTGMIASAAIGTLAFRGQRL